MHMRAHADGADDPPESCEARLGAFYCTYRAFFVGLSTGQGHGMTQHAVKNYTKVWNYMEQVPAGRSLISDSAFPYQDARCKGKIQAIMKKNSKKKTKYVEKIDAALKAKDERAKKAARRELKEMMLKNKQLIKARQA